MNRLWLYILYLCWPVLLKYSNPMIVKHIQKPYNSSIVKISTLYFHNDEEKKLQIFLINLEFGFVLLWQFLRINCIMKQIFSPQSCLETSLSSLSCSSSYELGLSSPAEPKHAQWQEIPNWISVNLANYEFFGDHFNLSGRLTNLLSMKAIILNYSTSWPLIYPAAPGRGPPWN